MVAMSTNSTPLKFKLSSKKLSSGHCQIKFYVKDQCKEDLYGYALVDSKLTLKEVMEYLEYQVRSRSYKPYDLNSFIFRNKTGLEQYQSPIKNFLIFKY